MFNPLLIGIGVLFLLSKSKGGDGDSTQGDELAGEDVEATRSALVSHLASQVLEGELSSDEAINMALAHPSFTNAPYSAEELLLSAVLVADQARVDALAASKGQAS